MFISLLQLLQSLKAYFCLQNFIFFISFYYKFYLSLLIINFKVCVFELGKYFSTWRNSSKLLLKNFMHRFLWAPTCNYTSRLSMHHHMKIIKHKPWSNYVSSKYFKIKCKAIPTSLMYRFLQRTKYQSFNAGMHKLRAMILIYHKIYDTPFSYFIIKMIAINMGVKYIHEICVTSLHFWFISPNIRYIS